MAPKSPSHDLPSGVIRNLLNVCRQHGVRPTRFILVVDVRTQTMSLLAWRLPQREWRWNREPAKELKVHASYPLSLTIPMNLPVATPVKAWIRFAKHASSAGSPVFAELRRGRRRQLRFRVPMRARRVWKLPIYKLRRRYRVSTSRFGVGQKSGSNQTPLGWHRIAEKVGAGQPIGTAFRSRRAVGLTWQGLPAEPIVHRILWLEGLQPGFNRGGEVDSRSRYIYIHGTNDELTLGRPASRGCIHLAAADLLPLFDRLPVGTLVWIR